MVGLNRTEPVSGVGMLLYKMRRQMSTVDAGAAWTADEDAVLDEKRKNIGYNSILKKISRTITNKTKKFKIEEDGLDEKPEVNLDSKSSVRDLTTGGSGNDGGNADENGDPLNLIRFRPPKYDCRGYRLVDR